MYSIYPVSSCFDKDVRILAYFTYKKDAKELVDRLDTPGSMSSFHVGEPLRVYQTIEDYDKNNPETLRQKALNKLTTEEKEALGIRE